MTTIRLVIICGGIALLAGCTEEPPPRSVSEFLENRILLEATMVRCGANRNMSKYEAECVNAREAINRIAVEEEKARREEVEAQFERKRRSLRRTQEAAAEARRRAAEARRRREEAEYLGVFENNLPGTESGSVTLPDPNNPQTIIEPGDAAPAPAEDAQQPGQVGQDLETIRQELRRRQESEPGSD